METVVISLPRSGKEITVALNRKKMKTCRLKVYPGQRVELSLPSIVPMEWVISFLNEKSHWIETKIESFQKTAGYAATDEIRNGYSIQLLGEDLIFAISECNKDKVYREGKIIHICTSMPSDQVKTKRLFENWWRSYAQTILEQRLQEWYPIIEKYGIPKPRVFIRKMNTLWGSCSVNRKVITFNFYLIKARIPYIDYVVLHELVHFLYPNHSKHFYDFLSNYMPDWKERKKILDQDVVHGL